MQQINSGVSGSLDSKSKYFTAGRIKPLPVLNEEGELTDLSVDEEPHAGGSNRPNLRKRVAPKVSGVLNPPGKKRKASRPYAPPERYAHLAYLPDYLKYNLDGETEVRSRD